MKATRRTEFGPALGETQPGAVDPAPDVPLWRFYYGRYWGDPAAVAEQGEPSGGGLTWFEARDRAVAAMTEYVATPDECEHCLAQAEETLVVLLAAVPGARICEMVDGADVVVHPMAGT